MRTYSLATGVRVLVFARGWSPATEPATRLALLRVRVTEAGVELVVVGERGAWFIGVDGGIGFVDRLAGDVPLSAAVMQAKPDTTACLIDGGRIIRIVHDGTLVDAVTGASELLAMRQRAASASQDSTMPDGLFAPVFETNDTSEAEVQP